MIIFANYLPSLEPSAWHGKSSPVGAFQIEGQKTIYRRGREERRETREKKLKGFLFFLCAFAHFAVNLLAE